ncbi:MAG TPA: PhzF family phenazine biosynthesis protein, partial [Thermoanaerobaculia bacterium]|nr:PhzF family phenazine biosynthesis protein [Thermoanaerobaculia bacterium]
MTRILTVDAFTSEPFRGNPAGVCFLEEPKEDAWMQRVASELNLAETAFLRPKADGDFDLKWFTPTIEMDLCGHATLASAHFLWESGRLPAGKTARFHTKSGLLTADLRGDWIELDFPSTPDTKSDPPAGLLEALGAEPRYVGRSVFDYIVELDSEASVAALSPDLGRLAKVRARGVIATAPSAVPGYDFVSRFFAPAAGVDEDPVTGSAHCCLVPFWNR